MAKKAKQEGEVNKSESIRLLLKENPKIKATEAVTALASRGVVIKAGLFYIVKGKALGRKKRRKTRERQAVSVVETAATTPNHSDAVSTIIKVKKFAAELGGMRVLRELVEALAG